MAKEAVLQVRHDTEKRIGVAKDEFTVPESVDRYNDKIEDMFWGH